MKNVTLLTLLLSISSVTVIAQSNSKKTTISNFNKEFKLPFEIAKPNASSLPVKRAVEY